MSQFTTLARPYAKAAFKTAEEGSSLQVWSKGLGLLAALMQETKVAGYMANPAHNGDQLAAVLIELCGSELDGKLQNFVRLLAGNKRLPLLPEISSLYEALKAERERTVDVTVVSAFPLDAAAEAKLAASLKARLDREVKLSSSVDKTLIGGMVVRAGDLVIDSSVRGKLKKLTETMNA
jgi:F-type H+-transporting ATPase subunit delta